MSKKGVLIFFASFLVATFAVAAAFSSEKALDDLMTSKVGSFPKRWRTWPFQRGEASQVYKVGEENGGRYIRAYDDRNFSQQIFLNFDWRFKDRPILSWRWRTTELPQGAKESDDDTNDSACGVYVVFGRYEGHAIKYVWSTTLPVGTVVTRRNGRLKIKVLDGGAANKNKWVEHQVDARADYESLFGDKPEKKPSGIALLTDGNAVHKPSGCDYADFKISDK